MLCQGQTLSIAENDVLFNLIGTTYGGDGQTTFNLPNLSSRVPMHMGTGPGGQTFPIGQTAGEEQVTLTTSQVPGHTHVLQGNEGNATASSPGGNLPASPPAAGTLAYGTDAPLVQLDPATVGTAGGSQPHDNMQPFLVINFIISLFGVFPSPT